MWLYHHVRYWSHLALQGGSCNWVHKTRIHSIQRWHHFVAKTRRSTILLEKWLHPSLNWIWYSWSGSTIILYYINLLVSWNTLLRNQISLCQHVFNYSIFWIKLYIFWIAPNSIKPMRGYYPPPPNWTRIMFCLFLLRLCQ